MPLSDFFQCSLSVDCVIFGFHHNDVKVLLIKRGAEPFLGDWALPGDLMYPDENLNCAAMRVLRSLTGIENLFMEQAHTFGEKERHPIGRVITVSYYALVNIEDYNPKALSWADSLEWHSLADIPDLAFDHRNILATAMQKLRTNLWTRPVGLNMLPEKFTLNDVQQLYELILNEKFDKANFRKRMLNSDFIKPLMEQQSNVRHRPAKLYTATDTLNHNS
ncbi:MAG: NUDIX hydrolase [Flavobacteriales bacterium]|nr:NUDIX hydrolase [Flavobacteriales bacterium]